MARRPPATSLSFLGLGLFGSVWGLTIPLTKIAVSSGHQPLGLIVWQMLYGVLILGAVLALRRRRTRFGRRHLGYFAVIGLLGTIIPNSFSYLAAARLPAGIMAMAVATVPMFALLLALGLRLERFSPRRVVGIGLAVAAMALVAVPEASLPSPEQVPWLLVALLAPLCYAGEGNYIALHAPRDIDPVAALFGASLVGVLMAVPLATASGQWLDLARPWGPPEWALLGLSCAHALAYCGYMWLVGFAGVVFSSQIASVVTVAAIALSVVFLGESYSGFVWLAMVMMVAGLLLVQPTGAMPGLEGQ